MNSSEPRSMIWHVVFAEGGKLPQSRAARSRDAAIEVACELLNEACDVRRIIEPDGGFIERAKLDEYRCDGRIPGLRRMSQPTAESNDAVAVVEFPQESFASC